MRLSLAKQRLPELDGLRGLAIFFVLVFHYISQEGDLPAGTIGSFLQRFVILGWTGVDLFFVLSGFLIGGILMDVRSSPSYFKTFYIRRFFRIVPVYYVWIFLYVALILVAGGFITRLSNSGIRPPLESGIFSYFLFMQNLVPVTLFGLAGAWFGHLWSLAVEEQFYLVAPVVVRFCAERYLKWVLGIVIVCVPLIRMFLLNVAHYPASGITTLTISRSDALAIGMLAAALTRGESPILSVKPYRAVLYAFLAVLFLGVLALWKYSPQSGTLGMQSFGYTWIALFYVTILLLAIGNTSGLIARFCRMRWLRELGFVSYCVYIIHIVVNVVLHALVLHKAPRISTTKGAIVTVLAGLLSFAIAKMSLFVFEGPLQRRGHAFKY